MHLGNVLSLPLTAPVAVMAAVFVVLLIAPLVARRGIPGTVVLLGAGIAMGPHALGVLDRDPTMVLLGTIGLLYIMFVAGLEIDLHEFAAHRQRSVVFGLLTFILPQAAGAALGRVVFDMQWAPAILLGSIFASHTLLAYPAVARMGVQRRNAVTTAVGATILTDTLALLVLAVVATGARSGGDASLLVVFLRVSGSLLGIGALVLWGLPRLGRWFLRTAASEPALEYVFVLACVFVVALGVELLGIEPIIGAFLAGLGLNRLVPEGGGLMNRITFTGNALFIPFFLLSTGMLVDLTAFAGGADAGRSWAVAVAMTATVLVTKGAAAALLGPLYRYTRDDLLLAFGLTIPQAAATIAAVVVGVEVGLLDVAVLNGTIAMVFVTCLVGPWVAEGAARRLAASDAALRPTAATSHGRLLVSVANPASAAMLVELAALLRDPASPAPLTAVTVVSGGADQAEHVARGERTLTLATAAGAAAGVPVKPLVRVEPNVARGLARAVSETRASTLVMGWDGSSAAERLLFGTVPDRVLRETSAAVLIARISGSPSGGRLVMVVPPLADLEPGFGDGVRLLALLGSRAGLRPALVTPDSSRAAILRAIDRARPGWRPETICLEAWRELRGTLPELLQEDDVLTLISARHGAVAWRSSLERLPAALAEIAGERSLLVLYPGQVPASPLLSAALSSGERLLLDRFQPEHVALGLTDGETSSLIQHIVGAAAASESLRPSLERAIDAGVGLSPTLGALVIHATSESLDAPLLLAAVSSDGVPVVGQDVPIHVLVALIAPVHVPQRQVDAWVGLAARMVGSADVVARLRRSETPVVAHATLLQALRG